MNALSKYTSLSIIALFLFTSINTHCMENNDSSDEFLDYYQEHTDSKTEQEKIKGLHNPLIATTIDQLFDEKDGAQAEKILSSLTEPTEREIVAKKAYELLCTNNTLSQKKALHTFILLNPHPKHNNREFVYAQKCITFVLDKSNMMNKLDVVTEFIELVDKIDRRIQECIDAPRESNTIEKDCTCTLF